MKINILENKVEKLLSESKIKEAIKLINNRIESEEDKEIRIELRILQANIFTKINKHNEAINLYNTILKENPDNQKAKNKKEYTEEILKYLRSDIYASPNTWMDPWE